MNIVVNEELKAYIDPLTPQEHEALERSILAEGCRDALVLWGDLLIDGHNRYGICTRHGLPFNTVQATRFQTMEDVHLWMIDQHLGRRSVSDFQRGVLALRKKEIVQARQARAAAAAPAEGDAPAAEAAASTAGAVAALRSDSICLRRRASTPRWKSETLRRPRCWSIIQRCTSSMFLKRVFCTVLNGSPCLTQMP